MVSTIFCGVLPVPPMIVRRWPLRSTARPRFGAARDRLEELWEELRIPARDRDYFTQAYCLVDDDEPPPPP